MSSKPRPVLAPHATRSLQARTTTTMPNCLLCRVLWPTIVGHRHLQLDDSSEAKTLFLAETRRANLNRAC